MTSDAAGTGTLAARLDHVDKGRFVGRETELATLERCLDQESQVSVVLVYGPGGIGKSTLLRQFARSAEQRGWTRFVVEGRELTPTSDALESLLAMARACPRPLILIDTYERMSALGWYLRNELLPHLPDSAVVVIAGRNPPDEAWFDGGWEGLATELELDRLSAADALALVHAHGVSDDAHRRDRRLGRRLAAGARPGRPCGGLRSGLGSRDRSRPSRDPAVADPAPRRVRDAQRALLRPRRHGDRARDDARDAGGGAARARRRRRLRTAAGAQLHRSRSATG